MFETKFAAAMDAYEAFWNHTSIGRPILNLSSCFDWSWRREPQTLEQKWLDEELIYANARGLAAHSRYVAEGVPNLFANLGPGMLAACIGGSYKLAPNTVWFDQNPIIRDWDDMPQIRFDENSALWQHLERIQKRCLPDGGFSVSITDLGGIMDITASLRGTENLLYDLYDYSEEVIALNRRVRDIWLEAFDRQAALVSSTGLPYNNWMSIPSRKPWFPIQCDFCAMISPKQFAQFVLDDLVAQTEHLPRSIYHLDGPGEIPHLDMLLDIPRLCGIQWTSGDGKPALTDPCWFDMYKKIQDKKKNLVLLGPVTPHNLPGIERLCKTLDPTGLYMSGWFTDQAEGEYIVECIEKWCS